MTVELNKAQDQAVTYHGGPLLIIAGAGTGKTTVITQRILYLLREKKLKPDEIVALTFTEKAAAEMTGRLDEAMPYGYEEPWVYTFHGFCDRILRDEGLEIGLSPDYKILSTAQQWLLIKKHLFDLGLEYYAPLGNPNKFIHALIKFFSRLQDEDVSAEEIKKFIADEKKRATSQSDEELVAKYEEVFRACEKFENIKIEENVLDFGDLIKWTLQLLRRRKSILEKYRKQFKYVLVDEFQDTNFAQLQLIKLLAPPEENPNLTVVGDDDQAIYAFRGSSVHNILDFKKHYPEAKEVVLTTNYRSGQPVLNAAYNSIQKNNPDRLEPLLSIDKKLVAARGKDLPDPLIVEVATLEQEADFVIEKILELLTKNYTYKDFAILARANNHLNTFVSALRRAGLPYQLLGNRGLFDQDEVRDLFFFLRVAANPFDATSLFQFLHIEVFNLDPAEILQTLNRARQNSMSLWQVITERQATDSRFKAIVAYIVRAQEADTKSSITEILHRFVQESGYIKPLLKEENLENQLKLKNINLFFNKIKEFDTEYPKAGIADVVEYFDLLMEAGENPAQAEIEDIDTISLLTIHASKGLEWPVVFLVNMVSDRFPSRERGDAIELPEEFIKQSLPKGNAHLQEERRLFYVAVTRARDHLFLIYGKDYGGSRSKRPSGFLGELEVKTESWAVQARQLSWLTQPLASPPPKPRKVIDGKVELTHISYSQIETYKNCPMRYKYQYILQVPTKPHHSFTFGSTIHSVLQKFHNFELHGQQPDMSVLLHIYEREFQTLGYESEQHRMKRFEAGKEALKKYFNTYKTQFTGVPHVLEKSFKLNIAGVPMYGRIDRMDKLSNTFELIDYKTGSVKDQKEVDKDAQLTIYAMASQTLFGGIPEVLSLYFIDDTKKISTIRTQDQVDEKKEEITEVISKIKDGLFEATPGIPVPCDYCPYNQICPNARKI